MQLHTLTFAAIGPFRDEQHIDFGQLAAGGLFLLEGPTGAGKSTVIDAVVFALYGNVAGHGSSKDRLVSDHRDLATEPFVDLVFETGTGVYRVRRTPEYERPKKRGDGTVTQQASVKLWKATSPDGLDGDPLSTRAGEADQEIRDSIGLSREQFVKTVVLPQGEFARFLQSRSDERRDILQSIFGTEHYELVQAELKRRRIQARQDCDDADRRLRHAVESFARAAGHDDDAGVYSLIDAVLTAVTDTREAAESALATWTGEVVEALESALDDLGERQAEAESARAAAVAELHDRQRRRDRRDRLRAALAEQRTLEAERDEHRARERRLDAARRAATCRSAFDALDDAQARLDRGTQQVADLRATVVLDGIDVPTAGHAEVVQAHQELREAIVALSEVHELESGLANRRDDLRTRTRHREKLAENLADIQRRCAELPAELDQLRAESDSALERAATLTALHRERADIVALLDLQGQFETARSDHAAAEAACQAAITALADADARVSELRRRYLEGIAADLAVELAPGVACPVCGSAEHPHPAARADGFVERDEVDAAERARQERQQHLDACRERLSTAAAAVAELAGRLDGSTADDLRERHDSVRAAIVEAEAAEQRVGELRSEIDRREHELQNSRDQQRHAETDLARLDTHIAWLTEKLDADDQRVSTERGGFSTVAARVSALRRRASEAERLAAALAELEHRAAARVTCAEQLGRAVAQAGFESVAEARAALIADDELTALQAQVDEWSRRWHAVEGRLAEPDLADVDPTADIDVDGARALAESCEAQLLELQRARATGDDRLDRSRTAAADVVDAVAVRRQVHDTAAPIIRMAGLANADTPDNAVRMALATYVLQRRFDSVVDAANERLRDMSSGRYALESHGGPQGGSRRTGLGLHVVDAHTGRARDTGTLSGGEMFYVSLALALGLADVVTAEAGGLRMGTLFVDEGFGSLDLETLDDVMGVLAALRSGGRVVGVVSHVEELKTRIPERIEVRRPRRGGPSSLHVVA